jgi:type I restriction enzyme S subunit
MSDERIKQPVIRFKGYTDEWEERKLGEMVDISSASRVHKDEWTTSGVPFFRTSDVLAIHNGNMNQKAFISSELYEKLVKKSGKVKKDDILVTGGGSIGMPYLVLDDRPFYFKDADLIWLKSGGIINGYLLYTFFISPFFRQYLKSISHIGTISHYTIEQAKVTPINLPEKKEQKKIGSFFKKLDDTITLYQRELDLLKQTKQTYLKKMFPKTGEDRPEIRFAGFTDAWERCKLQNVLTVSKKKNKYNNYSKEQVLSVSREVGTVNQIAYHGRSFAGLDITRYKVVYPGQLIYTKSPLKNAPYGIFQIATIEGIVSPLYAVYNSTEQVLASFIGLQLKNDNIATHYLSPLVSKGAKNTINITDEGALAGNIIYPFINEQKEITSFFKQLDDTITLHQRKLDTLKAIKKSLLKQMFV